MTFDNRLDEFNFHLETMNMLKSESDNVETTVETMESVGFSKELTKFLLETNTSYFNGVMLRLKLYSKRNMTNSNVKNELKMHSLLHPLVDYLFINNKSIVEPVKEHVKEPVKVNNNVSNIEEKVVESDDEESEEEVNHFDKFYSEVIIEDKEGMLKSKEVYERFSSWYEENVDSDIPSKDELKDYLTDKIGKGDKKGWKGVSLSV